MPVCVSEVRNGAIVVAESAAASGSRAPVAAGAKLPFVAPFGREFVAWSSKREQKQWVAAAGPVTDTFRRRIDLVLAEIRHRGYGIERLSDPLLRVFAALKAIDNQAPPDAVSTRLAAAVADLTVVDYLPEELAEAEGSRLATISAPIFDHAGSVVMTVSAQPYSPLTRSQIEDIGAHVIEFARSAEAVIRSSTTAHRLTMGRPG
ncbi:transcriptional regulator [Mycolicibacterium acapulense]|nr:transcriptional regulator [Mycolicibacterium acapulense]KUI03483.1 transcriptional regulator [Mycolicibacterium acapulense]